MAKKIKKATINPKNNVNKCFQCDLTVALNYQNIKNNQERISKTKPFINQYNQEEIDFPSHKKDWKKFELNNNPIALNILFVPYNNTEEIRHAYKSKYDEKHQSKVILLMITAVFSVKKLSVLLIGIKSKYILP